MTKILGFTTEATGCSRCFIDETGNYYIAANTIMPSDEIMTITRRFKHNIFIASIESHYDDGTDTVYTSLQWFMALSYISGDIELNIIVRDIICAIEKQIENGRESCHIHDRDCIFTLHQECPTPCSTECLTEDKYIKTCQCTISCPIWDKLEETDNPKSRRKGRIIQPYCREQTLR